MSNVLIQLIRTGKIRSDEDLKRAYRKIVLKTHPDAVGSNELLERYLEFSRYFEEAKSYIAANAPAHPEQEAPDRPNHRLAFFQSLNVVESVELPYAFHPEDNREALDAAKKAAIEELEGWKPRWVELYQKADRDSVRIKSEKPRGPYLKHALGLNIRPVLHNIIAFHLTGRSLYARQVKQNLSGIMHRLEEEGHSSLASFLMLLVEDLKNGPAVLE